ncbi:MAG: hypothetical protein ACRDAM_05685, partial [Casimicrobium sp.]
MQRRLAVLEVCLVLFLAWHAHGAHLFTASHTHPHHDFKVLEARQMAGVDHCIFCLMPSFVAAPMLDSGFGQGEATLLPTLTRAAFKFEESSLQPRAPPG